MPLGKVLSRAPSARSEANRVTEKRTGKGELSALAMRGDAPERISHSDDERIKRNAKGLRDPVPRQDQRGVSECRTIAASDDVRHYGICAELQGESEPQVYAHESPIGHIRDTQSRLLKSFTRQREIELRGERDAIREEAMIAAERSRRPRCRGQQQIARGSHLVAGAEAIFRTRQRQRAREFAVRPEDRNRNGGRVGVALAVGQRPQLSRTAS